MRVWQCRGDWPKYQWIHPGASCSNDTGLKHNFYPNKCCECTVILTENQNMKVNISSHTKRMTLNVEIVTKVFYHIKIKSHMHNILESFQALARSSDLYFHRTVSKNSIFEFILERSTWKECEAEFKKKEKLKTQLCTHSKNNPCICKQYEARFSHKNTNKHSKYWVLKEREIENIVVHSF